MRKLLLFLFAVGFSISVFAIETSISIEHPRVENKKQYTMSINCSSSTCQWQSKKHIGPAPLDYFARELNAISALIESGNIPGQKIEQSERITTKITLKNNGRETRVTLGSALDYRGDDSERYTRLNQLILRIEFLIEKQAGKK